MAYEAVLVKYSGKEAGEDLSTHQYKFLKWGTGEAVILCTAATDIPCGVLQNTPAAGETAEIAYGGETKMVANGALTVGMEVGPASDGRADRKIRATDTTEYVCGVVTVACGAANEICTVRLYDPVAKAA